MEHTVFVKDLEILRLKHSGSHDSLFKNERFCFSTKTMRPVPKNSFYAPLV